MKIISKHKDYYDYLQGIYGVDEKLILNRTKDFSKNLSTYEGYNMLVICGQILEFVQIDGKYYFNEDIKQFDKYYSSPRWWKKNPKPVYAIEDGKKGYEYIYYTILSKDIHNIYPDLVEISKKCPYFLYNKYNGKVLQKLPSLQALGINKQVPAKDIWLLLSDWLGQRITEKEPIVPVGDDKTRIISAGFDLKTSFRH